MDQQRLKNASFLEQRLAKGRVENVCDLQISIFKTLEETDSLLDSLSEKRSPGRVSFENGTIAESVDEVKLQRTKSESSVIEDMHSLNHQLHILVYNLVTRLDESSHELEVLRDRIKNLDKERNHQRKPSLQISNKSSSDSSTKTDGSPTLSEHRNSVTGEERKIVLPESSDLPPLELPDFDYNF